MVSNFCLFPILEVSDTGTKLFFDDELRNAEVAELGVMFRYVDRGLDKAVFEKGLEQWHERRAAASDSSE